MIARPESLRHPIGTRVELFLPRPVASSKNRRRLFARGRRVMSLPSEQAVADVELIRRAAHAAKAGVYFHPDDLLSLAYWHDVERETMRVVVEKIGEIPPKAKKRGTRRDVHGMVETIADALQGVLYDDDRAIDVARCERVRTRFEGFRGGL